MTMTTRTLDWARSSNGDFSRASPVSGLNVTLCVLLVVGSTTERVVIGYGGYSFYFAHILCFIMFPMIVMGTRGARPLFGSVFLLLVVGVAVGMPAVMLFGSGSRTGYFLQLFANGALFLLAYGLFCSLSSSQLRTVVRVVTVALALGCLIQVALFPARSASMGVRLFGLPRPVLLFNEPTWVALFSVLILAGAVAMGLRWCSVLLAALVLAIFTRSALVIAVSLALVSIPALRRWAKPAALALVAGFSVFSGLFVYRSVSAGQRVRQITSLDTRQLDIFAIRLANGGDFSPFGSEFVKVFDVVRNRVVPTTSNVLSFDFYWKFGVGGLVFFLVWAWMVSWYLPRRVGAGFGVPTVWGPWVALALLPGVMQFNNAFGRPWLWVLIAFLLATIRLCRLEVSGCANGFHSGGLEGQRLNPQARIGSRDFKTALGS
ncbi:hypothetical protein AIIKEEIJ_06389 [Rhodococcus sp. YH1]|nr:hypothetical protein [Rhodococcus sp. YH1]NCL78878.1 hypothetical protein [Rhodococcus sp. YH1]